MVEHSYDLVVIGDHLGGLSAAALAAKQGRRVLVFENTDEPPESRPMEYLNSICGSPEKEAGLGRFFHDLGLSPFGPLGDDLIHFGPLHPPLQVILHDHRINVFQDKVARNWELEREFGNVKRSLESIHRREEDFREHLFRYRHRRPARQRSAVGRAVDDARCFARLRALRREAEKETFSEFLTSLNLPPGLAEILVGQAQGVSRILPVSLPWSVGLRSLQVLQGGLFQNASGQSGILNGLKEAFLRFGGECRPLLTLESVELPRTEPVRLSLSAGGRVQSEKAVFDLPLEGSLSLLDPEVAKGLRRRRIGRAEEDWSYGLFRFRIRRDWRPECMGKYLVIDPRVDDREGSAMTLLLAGEPGIRPGGKGPFEMEVLGFSRAGGKGESRRRAIWERLTILMPFLEKGLEGEPEFSHGRFPRYALRDRHWRSLEEYYRTGRRITSFRLRQATFLRHENYVGTCLSEGIMSGVSALL
jgi:hypothetical protein